MCVFLGRVLCAHMCNCGDVVLPLIKVCYSPTVMCRVDVCNIVCRSVQSAQGCTWVCL